MNFVLKILIVVFFVLQAFAKVDVQKRWIQTIPLNHQLARIEVCNSYECEIIGRASGYSAYEFESIRLYNSTKIKSMHVRKWIYGIGFTIIGSYLYKMGRIIVSVGFSALTFPQIKTFDELISARESFESLPNVLSDDSYELSPEQFLQVVEGLKMAVKSYDQCVEHVVKVTGSPRLELCRDANIVVTPDHVN